MGVSEIQGHSCLCNHSQSGLHETVWKKKKKKGQNTCTLDTQWEECVCDLC